LKPAVASRIRENSRAIRHDQQPEQQNRRQFAHDMGGTPIAPQRLCRPTDDRQFSQGSVPHNGPCDIVVVALGATGLALGTAGIIGGAALGLAWSVVLGIAVENVLRTRHGQHRLANGSVFLAMVGSRFAGLRRHGCIPATEQSESRFGRVSDSTEAFEPDNRRQVFGDACQKRLQVTIQGKPFPHGQRHARPIGHRRGLTRPAFRIHRRDRRTQSVLVVADPRKVVFHCHVRGIACAKSGFRMATWPNFTATQQLRGWCAVEGRRSADGLVLSFQVRPLV
jgi:hypothetical protein